MSTRCLVENFQLICYSQQANARWQYVDSGGSSFSNNQMVAVVKQCWLLVQGERGWKKRWLQTYNWIGAQENLSCSVSHEVVVIALISCLCLKDWSGVCSIVISMWWLEIILRACKYSLKCWERFLRWQEIPLKTSKLAINRLISCTRLKKSFKTSSRTSTLPT